MVSMMSMVSIVTIVSLCLRVQFSSSWSLWDKYKHRLESYSFSESGKFVWDCLDTFDDVDAEDDDVEESKDEEDDNEESLFDVNEASLSEHDVIELENSSEFETFVTDDADDVCLDSLSVSQVFTSLLLIDALFAEASSSISSLYLFNMELMTAIAKTSS